MRQYQRRWLPRQAILRVAPSLCAHFIACLQRISSWLFYGSCFFLRLRYFGQITFSSNIDRCLEFRRSRRADHVLNTRNAQPSSGLVFEFECCKIRGRRTQLAHCVRDEHLFEMAYQTPLLVMNTEAMCAIYCC